MGVRGALARAAGVGPAPSRAPLPVARAGRLPKHSGGTAADSNGLPFYPVVGTRTAP